MKWANEELLPLQDITTQTTLDGEDYFTIPSLCLINFTNWKVQKPKCRVRKKISMKETTRIWDAPIITSNERVVVVVDIQSNQDAIIVVSGSSSSP